MALYRALSHSRSHSLLRFGWHRNTVFHVRNDFHFQNAHKIESKKAYIENMRERKRESECVCVHEKEWGEVYGKNVYK